MSRTVDAPPRPVTGFEEGAAFVDGGYVPIGDAKISIVDTGFSRSDVTYDVVGVWNGAFFRLDAHLERFERSCKRLRLTLPHSRAEMAAVLMDLVRISGLKDSYVETICTRGRSTGGSRDPRTFENKFFAYAIPYVWLLPPQDADRGMDAIIAKTVVRIPATSVDPAVKNFHWGDLTKGLYEAYDRGARYAILLDGDGNVTEGPGYNVFSLVDGKLLTPSSGTLEGITRRTVIELAHENEIPVESVRLSEETFRRGTEMFATSTAGGVMPITSLDGDPVGDGTVGPVTARIRDLYWEAHADPRYTSAVDYSG